MPVISACPVERNIYRITLTYGQGMIENLVISNTGEYNIYYIKNGRAHNHIGKIVNVYTCGNINTNYILFDIKCDKSNRRERISFSQIQFIRDITPNNAYQIAVQEGFSGTVEDWLKSLKGDPGKDAYEIAVCQGFEGTRDEWLQSLVGPRGPIGPRGVPGMSPYEAAKLEGYEGTAEELYQTLAKLGTEGGIANDHEERITNCEESLQWILGM